MLETVGLFLLLTAIVWLSYRYYGSPESEYLNVLDRLKVNDFSHLETDDLRDHIIETKQTLTELDEAMNRSKSSHKLHHRMESVKLDLLTYELHKRECEKPISENHKDKIDK